jgi:hypothetical protein
MNTPATHRYKPHHFPAEIISHGVWLYFRFCLSFRDVEELLFTREVIVTSEAIRKWCRNVGSNMPINCGTAAPNLEIGGTSMRCFARFMANAITSGLRQSSVKKCDEDFIPGKNTQAYRP